MTNITAFPRCVIFDADGVILNSADLHRAMRQELAEVFGVRLEQLDTKGGEALKLLSAMFDERTIRRYVELWDKKELESDLKIIKGANEVFAFLKSRNAMVGILTNRLTRPAVLKVFKNSGIDFSKIDFFINHDPRPLISKIKFAVGLLEKVHANHLLNKHPKPDPRAIAPALPMLKRLPDFPKSVYYVGDNAIDLEFANANGFSFIGVLSGGTRDENEWRAAGAKTILKDISEIPKFLRL